MRTVGSSQRFWIHTDSITYWRGDFGQITSLLWASGTTVHRWWRHLPQL